MKRILMILLATLPPAFAPGVEPAANLAVPEVETILKRVVENAGREEQNDRQFKARYGYKRRKVSDEWNGKGELKKHEEKHAESFPTPKPEVLPPPPLTVVEAASPGAVAEPGDTRVPDQIKGRAFDRKDFALSGELLGRYKFTLTGQELVNGRRMLVLDFVPVSKNLPVHNFKDRFINKGAGRVWIDAGEFTVARLDARLTEEVSVLGGLVGTVRNCAYHFDRERLADGLWFTRHVNWHLEGRQLFFNKALDYHEEKYELKKAW